MSGLLFLTSDDFSIQNGPKGQVMCNNQKGFSLVLFYSTKCVHCQTLIPIYKRLPGSVGGCQFGMINVSNNMKIVEMSKNSIAKIEYVPYIVLYLNGRPILRYDGPHDEGEIRRFVIEVASKLQNKEKFIETSEKIKNKDSGIPAYTIGHPLHGDDREKRCYLDFDGAYESGGKGGSANANMRG